MTLTDRVILSEVPALLASWARWAGRPEPTHKLVANWNWKREKNDFPRPVSQRPSVTARGKTGRMAGEYDVAQVLVWWLDYAPKRGRPRRRSDE